MNLKDYIKLLQNHPNQYYDIKDAIIRFKTGEEISLFDSNKLSQTEWNRQG